MSKISSMQKKQARLIDAYKTVFNSPSGELVLTDLMKNHSVINSTFPRSSDPNEMIFREGERNVILRIFKTLKLDVNKIKERIESNEEAME